LPRRIEKGDEEAEIMMAKRILVPLDGSESAEVAASLAADLARGSGGGVRLLQVHPVPEHRVDSNGRVVAFADQEMERLSAEGRDYLETVEGRLGAVPAESIVRFGKPEQEILTEAEAFDADLIVLTADQNRSWLSRLTGRGLGERLLHAAPVPVVLVRAA
jgi:nucleotide-binding universal stress UspA family protein